VIEKSNETIDTLLAAAEALAAASETFVYIELTPKFLKDFGELFGLTGKIYMPYATVEVKYENVTGAMLEILLVGTNEGTPKIVHLHVATPYDKDVPLPYCSEFEFYTEFLVNMSKAGYIKRIKTGPVFCDADIEKLKEVAKSGAMRCMED